MSFTDIDRILAFIESADMEAGEYGISDEKINEAKKAIRNSSRKRKLPLSLI